MPWQPRCRHHHSVREGTNQAQAAELAIPTSGFHSHNLESAMVTPKQRGDHSLCRNCQPTMQEWNVIITMEEGLQCHSLSEVLAWESKSSPFMGWIKPVGAHWSPPPRSIPDTETLGRSCWLLWAGMAQRHLKPATLIKVQGSSLRRSRNTYALLILNICPFNLCIQSM